LQERSRIKQKGQNMYLTYDGDKVTVVSEAGKKEAWSTEELAAMPGDWQPLISDLKEQYVNAGKPITLRYVIRPWSN